MGIYLTALVQSVNPLSQYQNARVSEEQNRVLDLKLEGIGARLKIEDGYTVIQSLIPGGPVQKDGRLQVGDRIVGIQKEDGTEIDCIEKRLSDVVQRIRGPRGSKVRLIVQPAGSAERKIYELTRDKIEFREQHARGQVVETRAEGGKPLKIGVIRIPTFYGDPKARKGDPNAVSATADCRKWIDDFKARRSTPS